MSNEEYSMSQPSVSDAWNFVCKRCCKAFSKRCVNEQWIQEHFASKDMVRGWHIQKDASAAKNSQDFAAQSRFQGAWDRNHNSLQAPPNQGMIPIAHVPLVPVVPPLQFENVLGEDQQADNVTPLVSVQDNGEDRDGADSDGTVFESGLSSFDAPEEMDTDPAPPPAADDGVFERRRWWPDLHIHASEARLMVRMDQIVESFRPLLKEGLGELKAKCRVACCGLC